MAVLVPATALGHIERASYWPDPARDAAVNPPAGGEVPAYRPLFRALRKAPPGVTRVVCQGSVPSRKRIRKLRRAGNSKPELRLARRKYRRAVRRNASMRRLRESIRSARVQGWKVRPSEAPRNLSKRQSRRLRRFNGRLLARCRFDSIQDAVNASGNNDRIVIMPGIYTEPKAGAAPTHDPKCADLQIVNDRGDPVALSYAYQFECPNDQNLIAVLGRAPGPGSDPEEPYWDRHGIPNLGPCIRCNLQIEGSGVSPNDVVVDGGKDQQPPKFPPRAEPCGLRCDHPEIESVKHVTIRADRADGFVLHNVTVQHAAEHTVYVLETDGYRLERLKVFYAGEYGVLTFVGDHGLMKHCDGAGHGDSAFYPGSAAETGEQTSEPRPRYNTEISFCDMHHNAIGYSGTNANGVHLHHNDFYDNAIGFSTDVFTGAGHPGYPQDSTLFEQNEIYSNNFNPYVEGSDVQPTVPVPVGTGIWFPGGNNNTVRNNRFWDNWRRGAMLFSVPDAFVCGPGTGNSQKGCDPAQVSTSHRNRFYDNVMGRDPSGKPDPNGTDFWWDQFLNNVNNCWYDNTGTDGTEGGVTSDPPNLPADCATSRGTSGAQEAELAGCLGTIVIGSDTCPWFTTPPEPQP